MARPRTITIPHLKKIIDNEKYTVLDRSDDPNKCLIIFNSCKHTAEVFTHCLKRDNNAICKVCYVQDMAKDCLDCNMTYLTKLPYGNGKSRSEYRLASCNTCGNFILFTPQHVRSGQITCKMCQRVKHEKRCNDVGYVLLNKLDKDNLLARCKVCGHINTIQCSNLMRSRPYCKKCNAVEPTMSYVYLFKVIYQLNSYIKLGKSNNPYLRHLRFTDKSDVSFEFIDKIKFESEEKAFAFETYLKRKYKSLNINKNIAKVFMSTGFSELYCLNSLEYFNQEFKEVTNEQKFVYD